MSKFAQAFGEKYQQNKLSILTRTFQLGNHTFKVRIPSVGELEAIFNYGENPDESLVEKEYQAMTKELKDLEQENDIVVEGRSMRETAKNKVVLQYRITEYFKLLIPETGENLSNLEYSDIDAEFPFAVQMEFIERINEVISPEYKEARGK